VSTTLPPFIEVAPLSVDAWATLFNVDELPVLARTAAEIEEFRDFEDHIDAHGLSEIVDNDPLMTLKLFAHVGRLRKELDGGPETVTGALLMLGIPPFFRAFGTLATVEDLLESRPTALRGFMKVLKRSRRAATFALAFAVHRMDQDAAEIHGATLLYDFAELLIWLRAPDLALEIQRRQQAQPGLRSIDAQAQVLNVVVRDLQKELIDRWRIPIRLLTPGSDGLATSSTQIRTIELAIRVARHSAQGWDNPAIPDDVAEIADMLQIGIEPTRRLLHEIEA
jgi:HD-like signal output (HDOD) protein